MASNPMRDRRIRVRKIESITNLLIKLSEDDETTLDRIIEDVRTLPDNLGIPEGDEEHDVKMLVESAGFDTERDGRTTYVF